MYRDELARRGRGHEQMDPELCEREYSGEKEMSEDELYRFFLDTFRSTQEKFQVKYFSAQKDT